MVKAAFRNPTRGHCSDNELKRPMHNPALYASLGLGIE